LDLASILINRVAIEIKKTFPTAQIFSTLSPIPGFMNWLSSLLSVSIVLFKNLNIINYFFCG
jgi:hypothetical protein